MTVAPKLQKGLKRLFSAAILRIIATIVAIVGLIALIGGTAVAVSSAFSGADTAGGAFALGGLISEAAAGILIIIAFFLSLVGIINVSGENGYFKIALYAVLAGIVLGIIKLFIKNDTLSAVFGLLVNASDIVMFLLTCKGIKAVGEKLHRDDFVGKYNNIVVFYCLAAVLICIGSIINVATIASSLQIIGNVCSIISYFMFLGYLRRGSRALEGIPTA